MLGRLGFQFTCRCQIRHVSEVYAYGVPSQFPFQLTDAFQIRKRFDIAHRSSDFSDNEIELILVAQQLDVALNFIGDVGNNLNSLAQIVATAFFVDYTLVDASCRDVVRFGRLYAQEAFIMSQVEVGFVSVYGYITLSVLVGVQRSGVDVDVGVPGSMLM